MEVYTMNKQLLTALVTMAAISSANAAGKATKPAAAGKHEAAGHCANASCKGTGDVKCEGAACAGKNDCAGHGCMKAKDEASCKTAGGNWVAAADMPAPAKK
jgi:hypothetical protein